MLEPQAGAEMKPVLSAVFVFDANTRTLRWAASSGLPRAEVEDASVGAGFRLGEERGLVGLVGARVQSLYIPNTLSDRRWIGTDPSIRSAYFVPVLRAGALLGVLALYARKVEAFSEEHRSLADAYAGQLGWRLAAAHRGEGVEMANELTRLLPASETPESALRSGVGSVLSSLSKRELEVIASLRRGLRISQIATVLSISRHTARNHVKRIYRKLGVHSQVELLATIEANDGVAVKIKEAVAPSVPQPSRILVAGADRRDLALVEAALKRSFPAAQIGSAETLSLARAGCDEPYDLLVLDLSLGAASGELVAEIRARGLPLAILLLAAQAQADAVAPILHCGADDYLLKAGRFTEQLHAVALHAVRLRFGPAARAQTRVLYAEDNLTDVDLTRRHLSRYAPSIVLDIVRTPDELLQRLPNASAQTPAYDVLLLEFCLRGANALELLCVLRTERKLRIPIVLVTANSDGRIAAQAFQFGASECIVKHPGYLYALPALLEKVLNQTACLSK